MINGAFGYHEAIGYTLYYTTNFIFTGLAVAIAFHASLFNIGGEGQAYIGGLGVGLCFLGSRWRAALGAAAATGHPVRRSVRCRVGVHPPAGCRPIVAVTS